MVEELAKRSVLRDFHRVQRTAEPQEVDWADALLFASALTASDDVRAQDRALRVAHGCFMSDDAEPRHRDAAAVLLERMGNLPALAVAERRNQVGHAAWTDVPAPLRLDVVRRR